MANRKIRWSDRATDENENLSTYLLSEWGVEVTIRVRNLIDEAVARIHRTPEHFAIFLKRKNVRRCVVSPQTSIFFKVYKKEIVIMSIFDNRQNPRKRKL
jgi:plasmid stabilization system protein ParE